MSRSRESLNSSLLIGLIRLSIITIKRTLIFNIGIGPTIRINLICVSMTIDHSKVLANSVNVFVVPNKLTTTVKTS
jgi:hypothetical protein